MLDASLFYQALNEQLGLVIETPDDVERVRQKLYAIRREVPEFSTISIIVGGDPECPQQIWLYKNDH